MAWESRATFLIYATGGLCMTDQAYTDLTINDYTDDVMDRVKKACRL